MANEIKFARSTGLTRTLIVAQGQTYWNASSMQADYDSAVTNGKLTCTEHDGSGIYYADMPAVAAGKYVMIVLDESDVYEGAFDFNWNGTIEIGVDVGSIEGVDATDQINAAVDTALTDINLDHLMKVAAVAGDVTDNSVIAKLASKEIPADWSSFDNTSDSLEAITDDVADVGTSGSGAITFTYTLTSTVDGSPIADADIWVKSSPSATKVLASGRTDQNGQVVFYLDAGTVYVYRQKSGVNFTNPDTETVA